MNIFRIEKLFKKLETKPSQNKYIQSQDITKDSVYFQEFAINSYNRKFRDHLRRERTPAATTSTKKLDKKLVLKPNF